MEVRRRREVNTWMAANQDVAFSTEPRINQPQNDDTRRDIQECTAFELREVAGVLVTTGVETPAAVICRDGSGWKPHIKSNQE